ncbi:hypothetical protein HWB05_gp037 [Streptomyces phage BRock]|uniref:Uncharacterized protein n=1 Tax=Streptomyces phage BRock TaxID=1913591 RepID=A0A1J0GVU6_9CAUD|nr:hypothetical protein HWB05_gp037 [Streptomyces phage BRock]APC46299.1 hypothetical protein [Streptomyces phage BRock]
MATSPHNLSAAGAMGAQFKTNILDKPAGVFKNVVKANIAQQEQRTRAAGQARDHFANSALNLANQGRANVAKQAAARVSTAHNEALRENNQRQNAQRTQMATAQTAAIREDAQRTKARTSMVNTAHNEAIREQSRRTTAATRQDADITRARTAAHGEALKEQANRSKVMRQQVNYAHGEAIKESKTRSKLTSPGTPRVSVVSSSTSTPAPSGGNVSSEQFKPVLPKTVEGTTRAQTLRGEPVPSMHQEMQRRMGKTTSTPVLEPVSRRTPSSTPSPHSIAQTRFADVRPRDNSPFPTHQHPQGSSNLKLGNLTAAQPKPNEFTVGSRANKPGGIASKGSQLEAWAISKQQATQARTASRRAGGRDKDLAASAKKAENFANQPLRNFAP